MTRSSPTTTPTSSSTATDSSTRTPATPTPAASTPSTSPGQPFALATPATVRAARTEEEEDEGAPPQQRTQPRRRPPPPPRSERDGRDDAEESGRDDHRPPRGQSYSTVTDDGASAATGKNSFVVGADGIDDVSVRTQGNDDIVTYDDSNVTIGGPAVRERPDRRQRHRWCSGDGGAQVRRACWLRGRPVLLRRSQCHTRRSDPEHPRRGAHAGRMATARRTPPGRPAARSTSARPLTLLGTVGQRRST